MDFISFDNKVKYVDELEKVVLTNHSDTLLKLIEILKKYDITLSKAQTNTSFEEEEQPDLLPVEAHQSGVARRELGEIQE